MRKTWPCIQLYYIKIMCFQKPSCGIYSSLVNFQFPRVISSYIFIPVPSLKTKPLSKFPHFMMLIDHNETIYLPIRCGQEEIWEIYSAIVCTAIYTLYVQIFFVHKHYIPQSRYAIYLHKGKSIDTSWHCAVTHAVGCKHLRELFTASPLTNKWSSEISIPFQTKHCKWQIYS